MNDIAPQTSEFDAAALQARVSAAFVDFENQSLGSHLPPFLWPFLSISISISVIEAALLGPLGY